MSTCRTSVRTRRTAWSRASRSRASGTSPSVSPGRPPNAGAGNHVSSTVPTPAPSDTTVARPQPCALCSLTLDRLLTGATVDALPEEVRVTAVTRVLLDHVHDDLADLGPITLGA